MITVLEEFKYTQFITMPKIQLQVDQRPYHKPETLNLSEEKIGGSLELIGTGKNFPNRRPLA